MLIKETSNIEVDLIDLYSNVHRRVVSLFDMLSAFTLTYLRADHLPAIPSVDGGKWPTAGIPAMAATMVVVDESHFYEKALVDCR